MPRSLCDRLPITIGASLSRHPSQAIGQRRVRNQVAAPFSFLFQAQSYGFLSIFDQAKQIFLTFFRYFPQKRKAFCSPCACPPQWSADSIHPAYEALASGRIWQFTLAVERDLKPLSALSALALSMANKLMADIEPLVSPMKKIYHTLPFRIAMTQPKGIVAPLIFYP